MFIPLWLLIPLGIVFVAGLVAIYFLISALKALSESMNSLWW